jgi:hypothetical protein
MPTNKKLYIVKIIIYCLLSIWLSSCIVYPDTSQEQKQNCELVTKKITLKSEPLIGSDLNCGSNSADCVAAAIAIATVSTVISGSIMVAGNTVHWIEQQGICDDSETQKATTAFVNKMNATGGYLIEKKNKLINWLKGEK